MVDAFDGRISLRAAIGWAADETLDGTITFAHGAGEAFENDGTILLNGTELTASGDVVIDGDVDDDGVADIAIDAHGLSRVLHPQDSGPDASDAAASVNMTGVLLTDGHADHGGAVLVDANGGCFKVIGGRIRDSVAEGGGADAGTGGGIMMANRF